MENKNYTSYGITKYLNSTTKIVASTAILYFLIAKLSLSIFVTEINILPFFPAIGFAIAAALLLGRKTIFGVAIGCLLFSISLYKNDFQNAPTFEELIRPLALCIIRPIIVSLNIFLVSYLTQLWCKTKFPFDSKKNVLFFALASLLGTFISVSIGFIPLAMTSYFSLDNCILIWSNMFRGNALGVIIFTPFVLSWLCDTKEFSKWSASKKAEVFFLLISTLSLSLYVFESHANNESILLFLLIWSASRFGMKVITLVTLIITTISIYCTGHHMGGFIFNGWNNDFLMLQLFLFVNIVAVLFLKSILQEKENEENKLKIIEQDLSLEKNILKASIESPKEISIFSLDSSLNYISFNSGHADYMKKAHGADIKIGDNHIELLSNVKLKEEITETLLHVLKGNNYSIETKNELEEYLNIARSPIKNDEEKIIGITTIITNITELKLKEIQLEKNNNSLNERIKELNCLYTISEIFRNKALSKSEKLEACVRIIPKGMQFPEITNCRIQVREKEFISANYQKNDWLLHQLITVNGEELGYIEVGYSDIKKDLKTNPFLDEEVQLLEALAGVITKSLETKLADEKLLKSEEKFRSIYENMQDVYFLHELEGKLIDVSPSVEKYFHAKRKDLIDLNVQLFYCDPSIYDGLMAKLQKKGSLNDQEVELLTASGETVYFSVNAKLINDHNGNRSLVEGSMRNINERINNQKELMIASEKIKESEKKYRIIFESVRDVFFRASAKDHTLLDISPSCSHFDLKPEELIGKPIEEFYLNPADRQAVLKELMQNGEIKNYDVKFSLNSKIYNVAINSKIVFDQNNEPEFLIGSFRDVTARIQAEEKLKISEAKFRSIYENFEDVYFKTTINGTVLDVSPSFEKHFLKPCSIALENSIFDLYYNNKEREYLLKKLREEGEIRDFDIRFRDGNENVVFFSVNARLIYDENGAPIYIEKSMRNVNDRIAFQKEMLAKNRQLEFQNIELEQFAYIASHDLQEPLITVIQCTQLLQDELGENLDQDQKQYLQFINSSTSRMQLLVKGLLDYSRIGKDRKTSNIDCNEIVANVLADMDVSLKESNAIIEYGNLPIIQGYNTEIRQLFQNLISNANKYRKKDQQPKIKIAVVKEENNWVFSIEDNGIGIEEQDKDKVFVIFKRLHNRNEYQGTGIGLSHCKKIVEHHNGKIWVESKYSKGSTFKWTFPIELN